VKGKPKKKIIFLSEDDPILKALKKFGSIELPPELDIDHIEEFGSIKSLNQIKKGWLKKTPNRDPNK